MAVIDAKGLFGGERLAACSDKAKLFWPFLFLAANGYGRLELTYQDIISRVFVNFQKPPKEDELWAIFEEYANNFLTILYPVDGLRWWAQFDTSEKYLASYKTIADDKSPKPPSDLIDKHRNGYVQWKTAKSLSHQHFQKFAETSANFPKVSDSKERSGEGKGKERTILPSVEEIYLAYPRKDAPVAGKKAIENAIKRIASEHDAQWLFDRTAKYAELRKGEDRKFTPLPATWFNRGSYEDEALDSAGLKLQWVDGEGNPIQ